MTDEKKTLMIRQQLERQMRADERNIKYALGSKDMRTVEHVVAACAKRYFDTLEHKDFLKLQRKAFENLREIVRYLSELGVLR